MRKYERPMILKTEDLAEGVYLASGETSADCWTISAPSVQDWNGSHHIFEVQCSHTPAVQHISGNTEVVITFSEPVTDVYSEFPCTFSGNTAVINRTLLADAYGSGDHVTYKVWAKASDEATTKALTVSGISITCTHETNVQGIYD